MADAPRDPADLTGGAGPVLADGSTIESLAAEFHKHLLLRLQVHGQADALALVDAVLMGSARFLRDFGGHEMVRRVFGATAAEAERYVEPQDAQAASRVLN